MFCMAKGRDSNIIPSTGAREPKGKRPDFSERLQRRGRDSNPRTFVGYTLSKRAR